MHKLVLYLAVTIVTISLTASAAWSGAWPREVGRTFLSFGSSLDVAYDDPGAGRDQFHSLYVEYGLRPKLTLGLDGGIDDQGHYSALVFLRRPMLEKSKNHRFAFQGGVGLREDTVGLDYMIQGGFAWGKGIDTRFRSGWMSMDTTIEYRINSTDVMSKMDFTIGIKPKPRTKLMLQVQTGLLSGTDPFVRLAPSIARQFGEGRHVVLEARFGVLNDNKAGIKLGTWLEF